jgi:hypothetical protein
MLLDLKTLQKKYNLNIKGVLHIGAHYGEENSLYNELGIKNRIYFEAVPSTFDILVKNINGEGTCINTALGNIIGEIEMNIETANNGQSSSILEADIHLKQYPHITFNEKIKVPITKLDTFNYDTKDYNFINIDVQGYELEVFKGALKTLKHIDYIIAEVNRVDVYKGCAKVDELDEFLKTFGFIRVETTWDGITWGDALYIKSK